MSTSNELFNRGAGIRAFSDMIIKLQTNVIDQQFDKLCDISACMSRTIVNDGKIFLFGSGHSSIIVQEGHLRGGGLAPVIPILLTNLMLHENAMLGSVLERTSGLAAPILDRYQTNPNDMLFIFSNSGVNQLPVEMALLAKDRGLITVAVCSIQYANTAPLNSYGKRLYEACDYYIDNGGVPGDAVLDLKKTKWKICPTSTVINSFIWQCLVAETTYDLQEKLDEIPVYASLNLSGANENDQKLVRKWRTFNPHL